MTPPSARAPTTSNPTAALLQRLGQLPPHLAPEAQGNEALAQAIDSSSASPSPSAPSELSLLAEAAEATATAALTGTSRDGQAAPAPAGPDPRDQEVWTFEFDYKDVRGKTWAGTFTNRILTVKQISARAVVMGQLNGGLPRDSIDVYTLRLNESLAHLTFSLDREQRPPWAKDLQALRDMAVVLALYEKVRSHEDYFFRYDQTAGGG